MDALHAFDTGSFTLGRLQDAMAAALSQVRAQKLTPLQEDGMFPTPMFENNECYWPEYTCDPNAKYRSIDGSCNNLANPMMGRAAIPFLRVVPRQYEDGI